MTAHDSRMSRINMQFNCWNELSFDFFLIVMKQFLDIALSNRLFYRFLKSKSSVFCPLNKTFFSKSDLYVCVILTCAEPEVVSVYEQMFSQKHWNAHRNTVYWESLHLLNAEHRWPEELARVGLVFQGLPPSDWHCHTHQHTSFTKSMSVCLLTMECCGGKIM